MSHLFISYASEDRETADRLHRDLRNFGLSIWIDTENLLPGERWRDAIRSAIRKSALFLALLSSRALNKRGFVQRELHQALEILKEFPHGTTYLIPVRLEECQPRDERLLDLQWVDLFPSYSTGFERLLKVIPENLKAQVRISEKDEVSSERARLLAKFLTLSIRIATNLKKFEALESQESNQATQLISRALEQNLDKDNSEIQNLSQQIGMLCSTPVTKAAGNIAAASLGMQIVRFMPSQRAEIVGKLPDLMTELIPSFKIAVRQELGVQP